MGADSYDREVYPRGPPERDPQAPQRVRCLQAEPNGMNDGPAAFFKTLHGYFRQGQDSMTIGGPQFQAPILDLRMSSFVRAGFQKGS